MSWRSDDDREAIIQRIVDEVARATDTPPIELSPPLYDVVDPEALSALTGTHAGSDLEVTFRYNGCRVAVDGAGRVEASVRDGITASDVRAPGEERSADGAVARND
ncbi:HalOD1 output domain-containing protein [Halorarum salinum]|nr:HalOD1 output domain-containing protein [Halobaculum salinum]